jgi:hypothetical protein
MRHTAGTGCRVSAHTDPWPVAIEKGGPGKRIRATIGPLFSRDVDDVLVEFGGSDDVLVQQPDAATATPTAIAAVSPTEIGALREATLMLRLVPNSPFGSNRRAF